MWKTSGSVPARIWAVNVAGSSHGQVSMLLIVMFGLAFSNVGDVLEPLLVLPGGWSGGAQSTLIVTWPSPPAEPR